MLQHYTLSYSLLCGKVINNIHIVHLYVINQSVLSHFISSPNIFKEIEKKIPYWILTLPYSHSPHQNLLLSLSNTSYNIIQRVFEKTWVFDI